MGILNNMNKKKDITVEIRMLLLLSLIRICVTLLIAAALNSHDILPTYHNTVPKTNLIDCI